MTLDPYLTLADPANAPLLRARPILAQLGWPTDEAELQEAWQGYPPQEIGGARCGRIGEMHLVVLKGDVRFPVPDGFQAPLHCWGISFLLGDEHVTSEEWFPPFEIPNQGSVLVVPIDLWVIEGQVNAPS